MPGRAREARGDVNPQDPKRARLEPAKGAILKIKVHNFMTYTDAEIVPGPRLNLVLGPNGTGKSSLVNAICLGLAGSTQLLGRADNVRDFVRRGESEGWVQITLSAGQGRKTVIKRILKARDNTSEWKINGEGCQLKHIKEVVSELHVQLSNLCQFLPQDKVVEFAKMTPEQLLAETEKAIGDSTLYDLHQELIEQRKELRVVETAAKSNKEELDALERQNEGLKRDVNRVQEKAKLEKQVMHLEDKLIWTKFKEFKEQHNVNVAEHQLNADRLENMRAKAEESDQPRREKEERMEAAMKKAKTCLDKLKKSEVDTNGAKEKLDGLVEAMDEKYAALDSLEADHQKWQEEMAKLEAEMRDIQQQLDEIPLTQAQQTQQSQAEQNAEIKRLDAEQRDLMSTVNALQHQADHRREELSTITQEHLDYHEQMRRLTNVKVQRLRMLEQGFRGITNLTGWLDKPETKAMFKGRVYGPILCEITVDSPQSAAWLEQHCSRDLWGRFVTENQDDQDLLARESLQRFQFRPIITNFTGNTNDVIRHRLGEAATLASEGIVSTLDEVFQAPQAIKLVLCNEASLQDTYCGNRSLNAEQFLARHQDITRLLTPESQFIVRKSRYNTTARSMNVNGIRVAKLLHPGGPNNMENERQTLQHLIDQANTKKQEAQARVDAIEEDMKAEGNRLNALQEELRKVQAEVNAVKTRKTKLMSQLKINEKKLARLRAKKDPRAEGPALQAAIEKLCKDSCRTIAALTDMTEATLAVNLDHIAAEAVGRELASQVKKMEREQRDRVNNLRRLEALMEEMTDKIEQEKVKLTKAKKAAIDRTGPMSQEIKDRFAALPSAMHDIEAQIEATNVLIDAIELANPGALEEYNQRRRDIEKLTKTLAKQTEDIEMAKASIKEKKERWLPELRRMTAEINTTFGRSFARIGCAGEVSLHEHKDAETGMEDFQLFATHIKVRFRAEEELQLLTAHRQSGGERSVSTILYLIALQDVTVCPFRVVDEINQGMDPVNERKVFGQLVEAACKPDTPQCFLLTPKLLPDLPFSKDVTILQIFNGTLIGDVARGFEMSKILGGRAPIATVG